MVEYLYYCRNCNTLEDAQTDNEAIRCPECGQYYYPLHVTEDEWAVISNDEKRQVLQEALMPKRNNISARSSQNQIVQRRSSSVDIYDDDYEDEDYDYNGRSSRNNRQPSSRSSRQPSNRTRTSGNYPQNYGYGYSGKSSRMSIVGFVLSLTGCLSIVGLILGIIDLAQKDGRKKGFSIAAVVISTIALLASAGYGVNKGSATNKAADTSSNTKVESQTNTRVNETSGNESSDKIFDFEVTDVKFDYYTNTLGQLEYYGIVEVTNTGSTNIYLDNATFDLEDNEQHLITTDKFISTCPDVVAPGKKGYYYNSIGSTYLPDGTDTSKGVNLVYNIDVEEAKGEIVEYEVSDTDIKEGSFGFPTVTGRVTNNTNVDDSYCYVNVILYDSNGNILGLTGTSVTDLKAGSTVSFECNCIFISDAITLPDIASYEISARKSYYQF